MGFGTWTRYGEGRVLVSQTSSDSQFDTLGETGGSKTHTLSIAELPAHRHYLFRNTTVGNIGDATTTGAHHYDNGSESYRIRKASSSNFLDQIKQTQVQLVVVLLTTTYNHIYSCIYVKKNCRI